MSRKSMQQLVREDHKERKRWEEAMKTQSCLYDQKLCDREYVCLELDGDCNRAVQYISPELRKLLSLK